MFHCIFPQNGSNPEPFPFLLGFLYLPPLRPNHSDSYAVSSSSSFLIVSIRYWVTNGSEVTNIALLALQRPMFRYRIVSGCNSAMEIPFDFLSIHMPGDHGGNIFSLTTNYSDKRWNVRMENNHLTEGWEEFVDSHYLRPGDVVIFRKDGDQVFHVICFGPNGCLIEYAQHGENQNTVRIDKSSTSEAPLMPIFQRTVTLANLKANQVYIPADFSNLNGLMNKNMEILLMNQDGNVWVGALRQCVDRRQRIVGGWTEFCTENNLIDGDVCSFRFVPESTMVAFQLFWVIDSFGNPKRLT